VCHVFFKGTPDDIAGRSAPMKKSLSYLIMLHYALLMMILLFLIGCGGSPSASFPPTGIYGAADGTHLVFASWQQDAGTPDVKGTWTSLSAIFSQDMTDVSAPQTQRFTLSGEISSTKSQTATWSVGGSVITATHSGDHINIIGSVPLSDFQPATLVSIPSVQIENQLTTAFQDAIVARKHMKNVQSILDQKPPPQDSDPVAYAGYVQSAQSYVQQLQQQHDRIMSSSNPCSGGVRAMWNLLYPPVDGVFKLSTVEVAQNTPEQNAQAIVNASSLGQSLQQMQGAWQSFHNAPIPHITGLSSAWQPSQQDDTQAVQSAQGRLNTLKSLLTTDEQSMGNLKQQTQQLAADVQKLTQQHGC
jgi:hypothetical protein